MRKIGALVFLIAALICGKAEALFSANNVLMTGNYSGQALVLDLNLKASSLPAGVTFTRASVATDIIGGVVTSFSSGAPRISTTNGLLVEEARTNLVLMNSSGATNGTLTGGQTDPAGGSNGYLYTATNTTTGQQWSTGVSTISYVSGTTYTASAFVKAGTSDRVQLFMSVSVVTDGYANFYLNGSGSVSATGAGASSTSITSIGSGWYRIAITFTATGTATNTLALCELATGSETRAPTVAGGSKTMYFYGGQVEAGATLSSYIPTTTATVTRAADLAYYDLSRPVQNVTLYAEGVVPNFPASLLGSTLIELADNSASKDYISRALGGTNLISATIYSATVQQANINTGVAPSIGSVFKAAFAVSDNDMAASTDGNTAVTDSSSPNGVPSASRVYIGTNYGNTASWRGYIHAVKVWNYRRTNADIQTDTAP